MKPVGYKIRDKIMDKVWDMVWYKTDYTVRFRITSQINITPINYVVIRGELFNDRGESDSL